MFTLYKFLQNKYIACGFAILVHAMLAGPFSFSFPPRHPEASPSPAVMTITPQEMPTIPNEVSDTSSNNIPDQQTNETTDQSNHKMPNSEPEEISNENPPPDSPQKDTSKISRKQSPANRTRDTTNLLPKNKDQTPKNRTPIVHSQNHEPDHNPNTRNQHNQRTSTENDDRTSTPDNPRNSTENNHRTSTRKNQRTPINHQSEETPTTDQPDGAPTVREGTGREKPNSPPTTTPTKTPSERKKPSNTKNNTDQSRYQQLLKQAEDHQQNHDESSNTTHIAAKAEHTSDSTGQDHIDTRLNRPKIYRQLERHLRQYFTQPSAVNQERLKGTVVYKVTVQPDGRVQPRETVLLSEYNVLNQHARSVISRAGVLPSPPDEKLTFRIILTYAPS